MRPKSKTVEYTENDDMSLRCIDRYSVANIPYILKLYPTAIRLYLLREFFVAIDLQLFEHDTLHISSDLDEHIERDGSVEPLNSPTCLCCSSFSVQITIL